MNDLQRLQDEHADVVMTLQRQLAETRSRGELAAGEAAARAGAAARAHAEATEALRLSQEEIKRAQADATDALRLSQEETKRAQAETAEALRRAQAEYSEALRSSHGASSATLDSLQAQLVRERDESAALRAALSQAREEMGALRGQLASGSSVDAALRLAVAQLNAQLSASREENTAQVATLHRLQVSASSRCRCGVCVFSPLACASVVCSNLSPSLCRTTTLSPCVAT